MSKKTAYYVLIGLSLGRLSGLPFHVLISQKGVDSNCWQLDVVALHVVCGLPII